MHLLPRGVSWNRQRGRYRAQITVKNKKIHLGYFNSPEAAALAYQQHRRTISTGETAMNLSQTHFPNVAAINPTLAEALVKDIGNLLAANFHLTSPAPKLKSEAVKHTELLADYAAKLAVAMNSYPHKAICAHQVAEFIGVPYSTLSPKGWSSVMQQAGLVKVGYTISTRYAANSFIYCRQCDIAELSVVGLKARRSYLPPGVYLDSRIPAAA